MNLHTHFMHPCMGRYRQAENVHRQIHCAYNLCQQIFVVCQTTQLVTMGSHDLRYFSMIHQLGNSWNSKSRQQNCGWQCERWDHLTLLAIPVISFLIKASFFFCLSIQLYQIVTKSSNFHLVLKRRYGGLPVQLHLWIRQRVERNTITSLPTAFQIYSSIYATLRATGFSQLFLRMKSDPQEAVAN